jgi:hypothetical protein
MIILLVLLLCIGLLVPDAGAAHTPHIDVASIRFACDTDGARLLFAIVRENLWLCRNGDGWRRLWRGLPFARCRDIEAGGGRRLILATDAGLYYSADLGGAWARAILPAGAWHPTQTLSLADTPAPVLRLVSGTGGGALCLHEGSVLRSRDFGASWTAWETGGPAVTAAAFIRGGWTLGTSVGAVAGYDATDTVTDRWDIGTKVTAVAATAEGAVFAGTDGDGIWRLPFGSTAEAIGPAKRRITSLVPLPSDKAGAQGGLAASEWRDGVYILRPAQDGWVLGQRGLTREAQADHPSFLAPQFRQLLVDDGGGTAPTLLLGGFDGLFRSEDGGHRWKRVATGVTNRIVVGAASASPTRLFLSTYGDGAELHDRSTEGRTHVRALPGFRTFAATRVCHSDGREEIWMLAHDRVHVLNPAGTLLRVAPLLDPEGRKAHGSTLRARLVPPAKRIVDVLPLTLRDALRTFVVRRGGIGGLRIRFPAFGSQFAVPPDCARTGRAYLGTWRDGLFVTNDGGRTFISNGLGGTDILHDLAVTPAPDSGHELLAATGRGLRLVHGTAARWDTIAATDEPVLRTAAAAAGDGGALAFASTWTALLRGERAGPGRWTWRPVLKDLDGHAVIEIGLAPNLETSGIVLVAIAGRGLFRSTDGGRRFAPCRLRSGAEVNELPMAGQLPAFPDAARTIAFAPDFATSDLVWAASGTSLHESRDGGETWTWVERGGINDAR